jgi:hypothetical protein
LGELTCSRNVVGVAGPRVSFSWADICLGLGSGLGLGLGLGLG